MESNKGSFRGSSGLLSINSYHQIYDKYKVPTFICQDTLRSVGTDT